MSGSGVSFLEALKSRYGAEDDSASYDPDAFLVGVASNKKQKFNKEWEFVGFDQVREQQQRYDRLTQVELRNMNITMALRDTEKKESTSTENTNVSQYCNDNDSNQSNDALRKANLKSLKSLDLSANEALTLSEVSKLLNYFPSLETLSLCDIPHLLSQCHKIQKESIVSQTLRPVLCSTTITKLVLNNTGFTSCAQLLSVCSLPQLRELHLDNNELTSFDLLDKANTEQKAEHTELSREQEERDELTQSNMTICFPHVTTLSLCRNKLNSWGLDHGLGHSCSVAFPQLSELYLSDNNLPNLPSYDMNHDDETSCNDDITDKNKTPQPFLFLERLRLLFINGNPLFNSTHSIDALRHYCPHLNALRISYNHLLPHWNETLGRMYVIAALPSLTQLNRGQIRSKERLDSEVFYLQRGLAQRQQEGQKSETNVDVDMNSIDKSDGNGISSDNNSSGSTRNGQGGSANDVNKESISYALLDELHVKHKDLILSIYKAGATATHDGSSHIMLHITLRCENSYVNNGNSATGNTNANMYNCVQKELPSNLTISKLKALMRVLFQVDPVHQSLTYVSGESGVLQQPVQLENELQTLAFYGVSDGAIISVTDTSLR